MEREKLTPEQFVFWLNGFIEMENPKTMSLRQTKVIKDHLKLVFKKETPKRINLNQTNLRGHQSSTIYC